MQEKKKDKSNKVENNFVTFAFLPFHQNSFQRKF